MNDLCAPSSNIMFPSIVTFRVLTIATAVLRRQGLVCKGGPDLENDGVNSPVV